MNQKSFNQLAGSVFTIVFVLHVLRLFYGWDAIMGGWMVPGWISWVALALSGFLAWNAYKLSR